MAEKAIIITDIGYGDCGKGTTVDYLARTTDCSLVIRHNGGAQAAHNVVTSDGMHHTFAQFSSASFIPGVDTYLSRFMIINPLNMFMEAKHLIDLGISDIWDRTFVDSEALVITPWHKALNRIRENLRDDAKHGSCGQGIGETVSDDEYIPSLSLSVKDLFSIDLGEKLHDIRNYKIGQLNELGNIYETYIPEVKSDLFADDAIVEALVNDYKYWLSIVNVVKEDRLLEKFDVSKTVLFEGAQGVLLDQWHGFHPYTTWSTTTHENAQTLLREVEYTGEVERIGVMRSYTTRHGAGPLVTEDPAMKKIINEDHNAYSHWQGTFRFGWLDLVAHSYAEDVCGGLDSVVITGLDWMKNSDSWSVCTSYDLTEVENKALFSLHGEKILPSSRKNLEYQTRLCNEFENVVPVYEVLQGSFDVRKRQLINLVEQYLDARVKITSYGPRAEDKVLEGGKSSVITGIFA